MPLTGTRGQGSDGGTCPAAPRLSSDGSDAWTALSSAVMATDGADLHQPSVRRAVLASITPQGAKEHRALLRDLLDLEVEYRRGLSAGDDADDDFFENLYWVGFLLYCVGDPADTPSLFRAKHTNFDTACGMDVQTLVGAGVDRTLAYLRANGHAEIAENLSAHPELREDLVEWAAWTTRYFYG